MKKVLFITYFWPPSGKATLHWPLKIIKFMPEFGWQPVVLTVDEDTFSDKDESLLAEISPGLQVEKARSVEPFDLYRLFTGKKKNERLVASETISTANKKLTHRIAIWIRMNLFVPDARAGWYFTSVKKGKSILKSGSFDAIISLGPPHSVHLTGLRLSKLYNLPHFPVLIDPWVDIIYYRNFKRSALTLKLDNYFERKVMHESARTIFVTHSTREDYIRKYSFLEGKSDVLYWGYNEDDFGKISIQTESNKDHEVLIHTGNIFDYQNPFNFWKTVKKEIDNGRNLKIKFIGTAGPAIRKSIVDNGLEKHTSYPGFLPYNSMLKEMMDADFLLVCASEKRHLPGKLFEYLRAGKPIIAFGDDNEEVRNILKNTNAGMIFNYDSYAEEFFRNSEKFQTDMSIVKQYDRKIISEQFTEILNESVKKD